MDATAPGSAVDPLGALQTQASFPVSWSGDPGNGAPITGYDIKVVDEYAGSSTGLLWRSNTTSMSGTFTGEPGHTYKFFSRARDAAGNQEAYAATPDTVTTVTGAVTWIHFEEPYVTAGQRIADDYAALGVHFVSDYMAGRAYRSSPTITPLANARTLPNVLANQATGGELFTSANVPLVAWLDQPVAGVGLWLGTTEVACTAQATVRLLDCQGNVRATRTVSVDNAFNTAMELVDPSGSSRLLVVDYGASTCPEAIDELAFAEGLGQCSDTMAPTVTITQPPSGISSASASPISVIGTVEDESGILKSFKINGMPVGLTPESGQDGFYRFNASVALQAGGNAITVLAVDGAGNSGSDTVSVNFGAPATVSLERFHLTQRGIMQNVACDLDEPFVAGKFTMARARFDVRTASGAPAFFDSVTMSLYRKTAGGDVLVDTIPGVQYSATVSQFDSPAQMAGIHFWIPPERVDLAGDYRMKFQARVGPTPIRPVLEVPCQDKDFTFTETESLNILIQPVEAQLFDPNLPKQDHDLVFKLLDLMARMYPIREGYSPWYQNKKTGIRYGHVPPYRMCDGSQAMHQQQPTLCQGTGFEWTFKDTHPSGIWRVQHTSVTDPAASDCANPPRTTIGGRVTSSTLANLPRPTPFGLFRGGAPGAWQAAKYAPIYDDNHNGSVADDVAHYISEFKNVRPDGGFEWITDLNEYDQAETYRSFIDADSNLCWDRKTEASAPISGRWGNIQTQLWGPQQQALDAFNQAGNALGFRMDHAILWFPDAFHPSRKDFGMFDPGQGRLPAGNEARGALTWIRPGDPGPAGYNNVLPHELGHNFGLRHTAPAQTPINAWQAYIRDQQVPTAGLTSNMFAFVRPPDRSFFNDANYKTLFDALKIPSGTSASLQMRDAGPALRVSGLIGVAGRVQLVDTAILADANGPTPSDPDGRFRLLQGASGTVLSEVRFQPAYSYDPPFPIDPADAAGYPSTDESGTFSIEVALAPGMRWLEIRADDELLYRSDRSTQAPSIELLTPNGGEHFEPDETLVIDWIADDADGDALSFRALYSADAGQSWTPLASGLGSPPLMIPARSIPGGADARVRVEASDGFNTAADESDTPFSVAGKPPLAAILEPSPGRRFRQWDHIVLRGRAIDGESGAPTLSWLLDGEPVGEGERVQLEPVLPGEHLLELWAVDGDGLSIRVETVFSVDMDSDRDGMSDDFETAHGLDAGLAGDALGDADEDGLSNFDEAALGLDPTNEDTDGDGLHDGVEIGLLTDPLDRDSDDDGLADGLEDTDGNGMIGENETDPRSPDSDGDGIGDGIEVGVTEPLPDPDGHGPLAGTDPVRFQPDADPGSTTDPLRSDSDGDGVSEAAEDADRNGRVDPWETDPGDGDWYPAQTFLTLKPGLNLIALPGRVSSLTRLSDWLPRLGRPAQIDRVSALDAATGRLVTRIPDQTGGADLAMVGQDGLVVVAKQSKALTFGSLYCPPLDLVAGLNLRGFSCVPPGTSSFMLLDRLGIENISAVQRYSPRRAVWESAAFDPQGRSVGIDFPIVRGEGYFLHMRRSVFGFRP